jgi:hypothetical protein
MMQHKRMIEQWKKDPEYKKSYDALDAEFMIFDEIFNARKKGRDYTRRRVKKNGDRQR